MPEEKERQLLAQGAVVWRIETADRVLDLRERLGTEGIDLVLLEGGGETAAHFLIVRLVDKASFFIAPVIIGGKDAIPSVDGAGIERMSETMTLHRVTTEWCVGFAECGAYGGVGHLVVSDLQVPPGVQLSNFSR